MSSRVRAILLQGTLGLGPPGAWDGSAQPEGQAEGPSESF